MIQSSSQEPLDDSIVHDASLSLFQKILLTTDGTVTQLLELHTGLPIRVRKLEQSLLQEIPPAWLLATATDRILRRAILLCTEQRPVLYAESLFALDRLPQAMQAELLSGDRPIGLLWREQRMETYREIVAYGREPGGALAQHFSLPSETELLSRTYLIYYRQQPLGMITEKFPACYFQD